MWHLTDTKRNKKKTYRDRSKSLSCQIEPVVAMRVYIIYYLDLTPGALKSSFLLVFINKIVQRQRIYFRLTIIVFGIIV